MTSEDKKGTACRGGAWAEDTEVEPVSDDDLTREKALLLSFREILGAHWEHLPSCDDKRLGFIIARWQALPEHVRDAIVSTVAVESV